MISLLLSIPLLGSLLLLPVSSENKQTMRGIALFTSLINLAISILLWIQFDGNTVQYQFVTNIAEELGATSLTFNVGVDSLSIYFVLLTTFITPICILSNWEDINVNFKYYLISFLVLETLQIGLFVSLHLQIFYVFFESVLIPLFLIIGIWGSGLARIRASFMLFLYTLFGSLWMLLAILVIAYNYGSTDLQFIQWAGEISLESQKWLWLAFFISFAFKTPMFPVHIWLNWAHTSAPLGGSIILAAVILKLATYGFLRILLPIFPDATQFYSPLVQTLAIITLVYASLPTLRQTDLKGIVALSSVCHLAVVILGLFSNSLVGIEGSILLSIAHGFVSPALFLCVGGILYHRFHTRTINYFRGMALVMPLFTIMFFLFTLFNMGVPLSLNFLGEFLSLSGIFQKNPIIGILGATGIFFSACYSIWMYNRILYGAYSKYLPVTSDISRREFMILFTLLIPTLALGIYPNIILNTLHLSVTALLYQL
uniref:NADH-ubiquinone oxidoreductase chain 4 n=1 Tax=Clavulina sp. TaxID=1745192 RepID=A0A890JHZ0_9AGAM|nr:NADH dehydrogenase subunit 4 [Clavulina sp.]